MSQTPHRPAVSTDDPQARADELRELAGPVHGTDPERAVADPHVEDGSMADPDVEDPDVEDLDLTGSDAHSTPAQPRPAEGGPRTALGF